MQPIIAVDPGREKTGIAVVNTDGSLCTMCIVPTPETAARVQALADTHGVTTIACGNGTNHQHVWQDLQVVCGDTWQLHLTNESHTTEIARDRYWDLYPATGWKRWIPRGMRTIPRPVDDITAWIIGQRYLGIPMKKGHYDI